MRCAQSLEGYGPDYSSQSLIADTRSGEAGIVTAMVYLAVALRSESQSVGSFLDSTSALPP